MNLILFVAECIYHDVPWDKDLMRSHMKFMRQLSAEGHILTSGRLGDDSTDGMLTILLAPTEQAVRDLMADDPFMTSGMIKEVRINRFQPTIGTFVENENYGTKTGSENL